MLIEEKVEICGKIINKNLDRSEERFKIDKICEKYGERNNDVV